MDPLSISASITALLQLTSTVIQYMNEVKGTPEDRRRILSELASVNGVLFILQDQADQAKQGDQWSSTFLSLSVAEGPLDQFRRALERLSSKLAPPATGLKKLSRAIVWPFQKEEIKEILGSIERQKALLNLARQNDHIQLSKAIKDDVARMSDEVEKVAQGVRKIEINQMTSEHRKIVHWLDAPDPSTNYNKALKDRCLKTGSWFIESSAYTNFTNLSRSFLWLHGIPGCGKTVLSSTILENVLAQQATKPESAVLFFYFDFNDAKKQRHERMIRSLICQLSMYGDTSVLRDLYSSYLNGSRQPTGEVLINTLREMMTCLRDTYIILDALDECTEREELLTDLEKILSWEDANLHVLATSRKETDIEEALTPLSDARSRISIQSALVNADIRAYIHDRLQNDRKLKRWQKQPKVQLEIEDTLMEKADGMFRWVACQLDSLRGCFHLPHLRQALASLPKTLDDTYARILCDIDNQYNQYNQQVLKILQWLTFSARPLKLEELAETFAIDVDDTPRFDTQRRLPEPRDLLTMCSSLITLTNSDNEVFDEVRGIELSKDNQNLNIDRVAGTSDSEVPITFIRLAHFSVKEYLVSDRIQHGMARHYSIREIESHRVLAEDCLAYLLQFDEPGSLTVTSETLKLSPLATYAAQCWVKHAKLAERGPIQTTTLLSVELFRSDREGLLSWIRISNPDRDGGMQHLSLKLENLAPRLYYASQAGLFEAVKVLIEGGMDVNAQGGSYNDPLQAASANGHTEIVRLLLDNGADVNAQGGHHGNALQAASAKGHDDIVQLLLDNGADINAQGGWSGSPLQAASGFHRTETVRLLLENGANINVQGEYNNTALQASIGNIDLVRLLLDNGADVNARSGQFGTALIAASRWGRETVVKMLLDKEADVNAQGGVHGNALILACHDGHENVVRMLLDKGADVNAECGGYGTALSAASKSNNEHVVKLLLDKGADVNARDGRHGTALVAASESNHEHVVKLLLDQGADVNANAQGGQFGNALQTASIYGHDNVVKMLLDNGADVNAGGGRGGTALNAASRYGHENVVKLLLDKRADMNAQGMFGTALTAASDGGHENVVKLLLDNGADVNVDGKSGALQVASKCGHENVVKMLVAKGAVMPKEEGGEGGEGEEGNLPAQHVGEPDPTAYHGCSFGSFYRY